MKRLTEELRRRVDDIWSEIFKHPFVVQLYMGTLPEDKFRYYVIQDYAFLMGMVKAFSTIAVKTDDHVLVGKALSYAYSGVSIELNNYEKIIGKLGLTLSDVVKEEPTPTNYAYVNHILNTCLLGDVVDCFVSILPCYWSYMEIADVNKHLVVHNRNELYLSWINVYLSQEYRNVVYDLIDTINGLWDGSGFERRLRIFRLSSRYEYMFWDMSYKLEKWAV